MILGRVTDRARALTAGGGSNSSSGASRTRKSNTLKDFVSVCGPLGVSHLVMLSATSAASYLRIARTPHGPTVTFRIESYALTRDVVSVQRRPREPGHAFTHPPLVVLHGFKAADGPEKDAVSLASVTLQTRGR